MEDWAIIPESETLHFEYKEMHGFNKPGKCDVMLHYQFHQVSIGEGKTFVANGSPDG